MDADGVVIEDNIMRLKPTETVTSWTKLSAAGAPSEFAIRASILGGIATALFRLPMALMAFFYWSMMILQPQR